MPAFGRSARSSDPMIPEGKRSINKELARISEFVDKVLTRERVDEVEEIERRRGKVRRVSFAKNGDEAKVFDDLSERKRRKQPSRGIKGFTTSSVMGRAPEPLGIMMELMEVEGEFATRCSVARENGHIHSDASFKNLSMFSESSYSPTTGACGRREMVKSLDSHIDKVIE